MKNLAHTTLWFYFRSTSPIYTQTMPAQDHRLPLLLEDVRMVRHGNHIFIHLRSEYEWERAMYFLGETHSLAPASASPAA